MDNILRHINTIARKLNRQVNIMEVCGTHTVAIFHHGIRNLLPDTIRLISGPGCPVCVTSINDIDQAIAMSGHEEVILTTFGDMMRVPGSKRSFLEARAEGADVRIVYSAMECLDIASANPGKKVVFFATGFETTSPSVAATLHMAIERGIQNYFIFSVHKIIPPALRLLATHKEVSIEGFLLPGHVSTIIGSDAYGFLSDECNIPSVIAGFSAEDIVRSVFMLLLQIESHTSEVEIQYTGVVRKEGNPKALEFLEKYFEPADAEWRGIGAIEKSGLTLRREFLQYDAVHAFPVQIPKADHVSACRCGDVLIGKISPDECKLFGKICTPEKPMGACMVSNEGSCAAYFKYSGVQWKR